jgi:hypothetical protein
MNFGGNGLPSFGSSRGVSPLSTIALAVVGTSILSLITLLGTYILGGFDGLTGNGTAALICGVFASFALGIGLMAAVFYSSRGSDDIAHYAAMNEFTKGPLTPNQSITRRLESRE